ncbi:MAG: hypothetical protein IPO06_20405 [Leptospiraceae bacterium]|nr:hypothetical protein [Leptospiraceae bacterium]
MKVLQRFTTVSSKLGEYDKEFSIHEIFHETGSQKTGEIIRRENPTYQPKKPEQVVLSGPHIFVGNPLNKIPNKECLNSAAYSDIDFTVLKEEFLPRTLYEPGDKKKFKEAIPEIKVENNKESILDFPKIAFRYMCQAANERTLIGAIVPKGYTGINTLLFLTMEDFL